MKGLAPAVRFMRMVEKTEGCWLWKGAFAGLYGCFWLNGRQEMAHRAAIVLLRGATLPQGRNTNVDHLCANKACVNPDHLEVVKHAENIRRRDVARFGSRFRTVCKHGHEMTVANTYVGPKGDRRICRACSVNNGRRYRLQEKTCA